MNSMKNKKTLIISLVTIFSIILLTTGTYFISDSFKTSVDEAFYNMNIDIQRMLNGYSIKEIEDKIKYSQIKIDDNYLFEVKDKHIIELNEEFDDEVFESIKHLEVYTHVSFYLETDALNNVEVNDDLKEINIVLLEPYLISDDYIKDANYLDSNLGLLKLNDLRLEKDDESKLIKYIDNSLKDYFLSLDKYEDKAKEMEAKLFKGIYEDLLKDIVGSSLFEIKIIFK